MMLWSMGTMLVAEPLLVNWLGLEGAVLALVGSNTVGMLWGGVHIIRVLSLGYLAFAINLVFDTLQGGAGDTVSPMVINPIALWLVQIPLFCPFPSR